MNYGHHVRDLLLELKRSEDGVTVDATTATNSVPAYNDAAVAAALQDFKLHVQALQDQVEAASASSSSGSTTTTSSSKGNKPSIAVRPSILLQNAACQRNKRGLLAYHWVRLQRMQELYYWQSREGAVVADEEDCAKAGTGGGGAVQQKKNLCPAEADFLHDYQAMIARYTAAALPPELIADLRAHCTAPPLTVDRVLCRVVDETPFAAGPIVLESGQTVNLTGGSTHYLIYADCEEYIRSGALQLLETEEQEG